MVGMVGMVGTVGMVGLLYGLGSRPWIRNHNGFAVPNWQTPLQKLWQRHPDFPDFQSAKVLKK